MLCRLLEISTSGYYAWTTRSASRRAQADAELLDRIRAIHDRSRGTYGVPRVHAELAAQGVHVSRKRIARLMHAAGLAGVSRRKGPRTTIRAKDARPAPDLVERDFAAAGPDQLWVADITYIPTWAGFLYLAVVLDAWSRCVVGWAMATHLRTELVLDAPNMAFTQRNPTDVIHHSRSGLPVHIDRVRTAVPRDGRAPVHGVRRGRLRQRTLRELLRHARVRAGARGSAS
jgi:putative transposase